MTTQKVQIVNKSTVLSDNYISSAVPSLQKQVSEHFAPVWGIDASLSFCKETPDVDAWVLGIFDDSDQAGALGYHDLTKAGLPMGKVFARTDLTCGSSCTVTISHELLEMLADPYINRAVQVGTDWWAVEVGDPVEDDKFGYEIDGFLVSDFVYPSWFKMQDSPSAVYDYNKIVSKPLRILIGGYQMVYSQTKGWTQIGDEMKMRRIHPGSRREKRLVGLDRWVKSVV